MQQTPVLQYRIIPPAELGLAERSRRSLRKGMIDHGAFGSIRKATWRNLTVAVKYFHKPEARGGIRQELACLAALQGSPHIVALHGAYMKMRDKVFIEEPYLVLEYAPLSLQKVLYDQAKDYDYTGDHVINWALQLANGLGYIHRFGWLHRDIKPSNLLLFDNGRILKLCDFGTAKKLASTLTNAVGTIRYMAPEVIQGSHYSAKCDIFSYGLTMWEIIARKPPTLTVGGDEEGLAVLFAVANKGARPRMINGLPRVISEMITRCWHQEPKQRPDIWEVIQKVSFLCKYVNTDQGLMLKGEQAVETSSLADTQAPLGHQERSHAFHAQHEPPPPPPPHQFPPPWDPAVTQPHPAFHPHPLPQHDYPQQPTFYAGQLVYPANPQPVAIGPHYTATPSSRPPGRRLTNPVPASHFSPYERPARQIGADGQSPKQFFYSQHSHTGAPTTKRGRSQTSSDQRVELTSIVPGRTMPVSRIASDSSDPEPLDHGYIQFEECAASSDDDTQFSLEQHGRYLEMVQKMKTKVQTKEFKRMVKNASPYVSIHSHR